MLRDVTAALPVQLKRSFHRHIHRRPRGFLLPRFLSAFPGTCVASLGQEEGALTAEQVEANGALLPLPSTCPGSLSSRQLQPGPVPSLSVSCIGRLGAGILRGLLAFKTTRTTPPASQGRVGHQKCTVRREAVSRLIWVLQQPRYLKNHELCRASCGCDN